VLAEFGFQKLDEVGDVPRDGHVAGHGKFRAGEEGFELAEEGRVRLRFERGDEVAEEGDTRRGVGVIEYLLAELRELIETNRFHPMNRKLERIEYSFDSNGRERVA